MVLLVITNVLLLYFLNRDWFLALFYSTLGKISLAICVAVILYSVSWIMKLSRPIEYGGEGWF